MKPTSPTIYARQLVHDTLTELGITDPGLCAESVLVKDGFCVGRRFSFDPYTVTVPVGARVNIYATSGDVQHGIMLEDTNINMMLVPGQVSKLTAEFDKPGTYNSICHEFCGAAHAVMFGQLTVEG